MLDLQVWKVKRTSVGHVGNIIWWMIFISVLDCSPSYAKSRIELSFCIPVMQVVVSGRA